MSVEWTKQHTLIFINLYRSHECLWNIKHHDYKNKGLRRLALRLMLGAMRRVMPGITSEDVKRRISSLRNQFRREIRQASSAGLAHVPRLWCFERLSFLNDSESLPESIIGVESNLTPFTTDSQIASSAVDFKIVSPPVKLKPAPSAVALQLTPLAVHLKSASSVMDVQPTPSLLDFNTAHSAVDFNTAHSAVDLNTAHSAVDLHASSSAADFINTPSEVDMICLDDVEVSSNAESLDAVDPIGQLSPAPHSLPAAPPRPTGAPSRKRGHQDTCNDILSLVGERLRSSRQEDEFDIIGKIVSTKLRRLPADQKLFAERLVYDVLFEAELQNLNRNSKVVT